ncbi:MAG: hypothetical protein FJX74_22695 [Armatimonadetes bacterium]|nr:hypothetical protein [Armatimonadota bacterium]
MPQGFQYGPTDPLEPVFFAMPSRGEVLGTISVPSLVDKGEPREWAGLIALEGEDWTSLYSAAPDVPTEVLRPIARRAGVHVYLDTGDAVWANGSLLAVHALTAGDKHIRLPHPADVSDPATGSPIGTQAAEFTVAMTAGETRRFTLTGVR